MSAVDAKLVQQLRAKTGAGIMDCKRALTEENGQLDKAIEYLRKKGLSAASKKAGRVASEGAITSYVHAGGKIGVLVEINAETDFVGRNEEFQRFSRDVAMHIAAAQPTYISRDEISEEVLNKEKEIFEAQTEAEGIPTQTRSKVIEGRVNKFFKEQCLLEQPFVKDPALTVEQLLNQLIAKIGERIVIRRFSRYQLGEGIQKQTEDFASEVAKMVQH